HLPVERYRHAVIAMMDITGFRQRIVRSDVSFHALNKPPGHGEKVYPGLLRLFRELRPDIVHTRNLGALEAVVPAWMAGVRVRIHGEHGWDVGDFDGSSLRFRWVRRLYRPFVTQYIALSRDLEDYLDAKVGVPPARIARICNGVDMRRFHPAAAGRAPIEGCPFNDPDMWLVGSVARMQTVKDPLNLVLAFVLAVRMEPALRGRLRLVMVGDGPLRQDALALLRGAGMEELGWLPGERNDIPSVMRGLDCFVLPSRGEGISNTVLEAMACGLPVIATKVGGNPELVEPGVTGELVAAGDAAALARCILDHARHPDAARRAGQAGRARVERQFSLEAMLGSYRDVYDRHLSALAPDRA
ncbi:MAG: TIGR03088 family PEP-CTERM/XrtA system glycosyltransferase, partial [Zoogloea sp.]|nr:TIGR03088 family PEP-CTERM/XrtA system glycosyltransferase [Zoogloea sp.]